VAVTAAQEYGLFSGGEVVEPASGEIRDLDEPATGATSPKPFNPFGL